MARSSFCHQEGPTQPLSLPDTAPLPITRAWRNSLEKAPASHLCHTLPPPPKSCSGTKHVHLLTLQTLAVSTGRRHVHLSDYYPKILVWTTNSFQILPLFLKNGNGLGVGGTPGNQNWE